MMNIRSFFLSIILSFVITSSSQVQAARTQLAAMSVVVFDRLALDSDYCNPCHRQLRKRYKSVLDKMDYQWRNQKTDVIKEAIAKRLGAGAVLTPDYVLVIPGSACDITEEVIEQLCKEYIAEHSLKSRKISSPLLMLHDAILNDSAEDIRQAVQSGANVNLGKDGKAPLLWAVLLKRSTQLKLYWNVVLQQKKISYNLL